MRQNSRARLAAEAHNSRGGAEDGKLSAEQCLGVGGAALMRVCVHGLWHLGSVTAACLSEAGHSVVGLDDDANVVIALTAARPPLMEQGLGETLRAGLKTGRL